LFFNWVYNIVVHVQEASGVLHDQLTSSVTA
jgi:hypothetical protein